jgi:hypothetical protein
LALRRVAFVVLAALPLVACQATARVTVTMAASGRGTIAVSLILDHDAARQAGDLQTSDLARAGWTVDPAVTGRDGGVTTTLHRAFANPSEATAILQSLGVVDLRAHRSRGLISSTDRVDGTIDLRRGLDAFSDPTLARALGVDSVSTLVQQYQATGGQLPDVRAEVVVHLPGHSATTVVPLGHAGTVSVASSATDWVAGLYYLIAAAALIALVIVLLFGGRRLV